MPGCCASPFEDAAGRLFNDEKAAQEVKRYRRKGPRVTTRLLADGIAQSGALGGTVLDIGAGIGALTFDLLERGATRAVAVDASAAYVRAIRDEAARRGASAAVDVVHADFVDAAGSLAPAAIVTLDRVVCCYPGCEALLTAAVEHAERSVALAYPRDVWYVRAGMAAENTTRRIARNAFRTFVHPKVLIEGIIRRAGFTLSSRRETWVWSIDVYLRQPRS